MWKKLTKGIETTGYRLHKDNGKVLLSWTQRKCQKCKRFLSNSNSHNVCSKCAKFADKEYSKKYFREYMRNRRKK
jgi:hypothetical protein